MSLWFMGSGSFGANCLDGLCSDGLVPDLTITMPPRPAGRRGLSLKPTPVEAKACELGLKLYRSSNVNQDDFLLRAIAESPPEAIFVVDFGQKIDEPFLSAPHVGCLNVHPSRLPEYRGAAPVQRAIMDGASETGVTVFRLVPEMDAGPIAIAQTITIEPEETSGELLFRLAYIGSVLLKKTVQLICKGELSLQPQDADRATYAKKIDKSESRISWERPADEVHNLVRGLNPSLGAYVLFRSQRLKIWRTDWLPGQEGPLVGVFCLDTNGYPLVQCQKGAVRLREVQPEGRRRMDAREWAKGSHIKEGELME